jgi:ketosteroid isomerase-like protein
VTDDRNRQVMERFSQAWADHDLDAALACVADDCVLETAAPAPDGTTVRGREAIRAEWAPYFRRGTSFEPEESLWSGDAVVQRWRFVWSSGHVRGIDLITMRDGAITAKLSYVKA